MKLIREFHFDAAHRLPNYDANHPNSRIHGHSFRVRVTLQGQPAKETGQIMELADFGDALEAVRQRLDHNMLNEIEGLSQPTLEHICLWLWRALRPTLPALYEVEVARDSLSQSCSYRGDEHEET